MNWIFLFIAGIFEVGWPLGFKLSQITNHKFWIFFSIISMGLSGIFLFIAQKTIPIGTAYAIWTGIGAAGTFLIGIIFFKDSSDWLRMISFSLIVLGIIGLKLSD
ncbi:MAG: hypothetical protein A2X64_09030 [Ignavibacteria bacterium GWF2_33_9]|nr:MAG: hypothetical protein A2X64_09030 [Ignavibacteria bacterium GWF2_33_9]